MIHPSEPVLSAAAAAVLLTFAAASAAAMTPGVYSAAVPARNGELAVEVQVSADRIESVKVVRQQETPGIGSLAVEALPAAIVAQQNQFGGCRERRNDDFQRHHQGRQRSA